MKLSTEHFSSSIDTLDLSLKYLQKAKPESVEYEVFRNAVSKGFELTLETVGKLLRKALKFYSGNPREVDGLIFKDVLRQASKHDLLSADSVSRWFEYRDNLNITDHCNEVTFVGKAVLISPDFFQDAWQLQKSLQEKFGKNT